MYGYFCLNKSLFTIAYSSSIDMANKNLWLKSLYKRYFGCLRTFVDLMVCIDARKAPNKKGDLHRISVDQTLPFEVWFSWAWMFPFCQVVLQFEQTMELHRRQVDLIICHSTCVILSENWFFKLQTMFFKFDDFKSYFSRNVCTFIVKKSWKFLQNVILIKIWKTKNWLKNIYLTEFKHFEWFFC